MKYFHSIFNELFDVIKLVRCSVIVNDINQFKHQFIMVDSCWFRILLCGINGTYIALKITLASTFSFSYI